MKILNIILIVTFMTTNLFGKINEHFHKEGKNPKRIKFIKNKKNKIDNRSYLDSIYSNINGYKITEEDRDFVNQFGSAIYGEINYNSLKTILDELKPRKRDVFYDLGSGIGKTIVQASLNYKFKKCVGIELSKIRHEKANIIKKKLKENKKISRYHDISFKNQDAAQANLKNATIIYMCSTCFPDKLMKDLTQKFTLLKKGTKILTLKGLKKHKKLKFIKQYDLPMSWSDSSPVYLYEVI